MIKFRLYSRYDETDILKSSQDSSILNKEEKGKTSDSAKVAAIGALAGIGVNALSKANKERKENNFYNSRLREAQRAAKRREKLDWNDRIHNRQGYE